MNTLDRSWWMVALLAWISTGCSTTGGQTGEESGEGCVETSTPLAFDELSVLGFSPASLLEAIALPSTATLRWQTHSDFIYGPESGTSSITFDEHSLKTARYVESKPNPNPNGQEIAMMQCQNRVEVDLDAVLSTTGGALAESFVATVRAISTDEVRVSHLFEPKNIRGAFAFDSASLGQRDFIRLQFDATWTPDRFLGRLDAGIEATAGTGASSSVSFTNVVLACFDSSPTFDPKVDCLGAGY
jgi:hypothetical protein